MRRGPVRAVVAPVAVAAVPAVLVVGFRMRGGSRTVMDRDQYDNIRVGDVRADLLAFSLDGAPAGVGPGPADAGDCEHCRTVRRVVARVAVVPQGRPPRLQEGRDRRRQRGEPAPGEPAPGAVSGYLMPSSCSSGSMAK